MKKVNFKMRNVIATVISLAAITMIFSCEKPSDDGDGSTGGEDVEFTIYINGSDEWTPFAGKTEVVFTNSDNTILGIKDNGTTVKFTGRAAGNSTITATLGDQTLKALVRVRAAEGGGLKAATIHYTVSGDGSYSLCFDNYGRQRRCQVIDTEGQLTIGIYDEINGVYYLYAPEQDGYIWFPNQYVNAEQTKTMAKALGDAFFADMYRYVITTYEQYHQIIPGMSRTSENIAGQTCDLYTISYEGDGGTFGFWGNTVMLRVSANEEFIEADYARTGCPENAFEKVVEIDWSF